MTPELLEVSKRRHNFGTKRFKEKSLFIFYARIALKSLILLFERLIARGARIGKTHTDRTSTVTLAHARRGLIINIMKSTEVQTLGLRITNNCIIIRIYHNYYNVLFLYRNKCKQLYS